MALKPFGFIGGAYQSWSPNAAADQCVNLFVEAIETTQGKAVLYGTPGLLSFCELPTSPIRGIWTGLISKLPGSTGADVDLCFVVAGSKLYAIVAAGTYTALGDVGDDATHSPVQMAASSSELLICSAGLLYRQVGALAPNLNQVSFDNGSGTVDTSGTAVTWASGDQFDASNDGQPMVIAGVTYTVDSVTDETHLVLTSSAGTQSGAAYTASYPVAAAQLSFLDGYFIVLPPDPSSKRFYISGLRDGNSWNPLDYAFKEGYPDPLAAIFTDHEELWILGTQTTQVFQNTGNATFPLEPNPGAFVHHGAAASFTPCRLGEGLAWLAGDERGLLTAFYAQGFSPVRISTHAIEQIWRGYSRFDDAIAFSYVEQGHDFWVIHFPTGNATWVYDHTEKLWHRRGWWNGTSLDRQRQAFHGFVFGKHLVGDWQTGDIYVQSLAYYDDDGTAINRVRARRVEETGAEWTYFKRFRLEAQNSGALNPSLDWSVDGGANFNTARTTGSNTAGTLAVWDYRKLGRSRNRVMRITITAAVKVALIEGTVEVLQ